MNASTVRTTVRLSALALALAGAATAGATLAPAPTQAAPTITCGAYTQATPDLSGCEMLPGYQAVSDAAADDDADRVARLTAKIDRLTVSRDKAVDQRDAAWADLADITGQRDDLAADLQQAKNDLADTLPESHVSVSDPLDVARGKGTLSTWQGFTVGEVIVCPKGWTVSTDDADHGQIWAACM